MLEQTVTRSGSLDKQPNCAFASWRPKLRAGDDTIRLVPRLPKDAVTPHPGDTLVTLKVDTEQPLEQRVHLLGYAFIKVVQGSLLKQVLEYDLLGGCVRFIVAGGPSSPSPVGKLHAELSDWPGEAIEQKITD